MSNQILELVDDEQLETNSESVDNNTRHSDIWNHLTIHYN